MFFSLSGLTVPTAWWLLNRIPRFRTVCVIVAETTKGMDWWVTTVDSDTPQTFYWLITWASWRIEKRLIYLVIETRMCVYVGLERDESGCSFSHVQKWEEIRISMHVSFLLSMTSKPQPVAVETPTQGEASYEETHVHKVYEEIAGHFSETRYKVCFPLYIFKRPFLTRSSSHGQSSRHSFIVCLLEV